MTLSDLSIKRPVLASVMSMLIIVFGIASLLRLPLRELPDVDTSVVTVTTEYTGANPTTVDTDITEAIESGVAGISGVKTIASQSRQGLSSTTIEFEVGRNIDEAANDVRSAVARVRQQLPDDIKEPQIVKNDADADPVMRLAVTSDRMSAAEITDYVDRFVIDRLATLRRGGQHHHFRRAPLCHADLARPHRHGGPQHHGRRCRAGVAAQQCRAAGRRRSNCSTANSPSTWPAASMMRRPSGSWWWRSPPAIR